MKRIQALRVAGYLVPVALAAIGLILSTIALYAGHNENTLEEYALARVRRDGRLSLPA